MQGKKSFFERYLGTFFYFLALTCLGEQVGFYFSPLNKISGSFFLFLYLLSIYQDIRSKDNKVQLVYLRLGMLALFILVLVSPFATISVGMALLFPLSLNKPERKLEFQTGLVFFIYVLFHSFVPQFFLLERALTDSLNAWLQLMTGLPIHYSPYAYGFGGLVIVTSFLMISAYMRKAENNRLKIIALLIIQILVFFLLDVLYFLASQKYYSMQITTEQGLKQFLYNFWGLFLPMNGQGLIFLILLIFSCILQFNLIHDHQISEPEKKNANSRITTSKIILSALLAVSLFSFYWNLDIFESNLKKPVVYVYDTKMDFTTIPDDKVYGINNGAFAMFFDYLKDWGYSIQFGSDWSKISPQNHDILILINPYGKLQYQEKQKLESFMVEGGNLFVLGDHTYTFGLRNGYNDFLKELGIAFNFDSAFYLRPLWRKSLKSSYNTWDRMVKKDGFTTEILIGASLTLKYPAVPVIIGEYGWSDRGNIKDKWYMGNRRFDPDEPTGDLVLAAERSYGKGRLLVFGDTTFIQNTPISSSYPFIKLCFLHLLPKNQIIIRIGFPLLFLIGIILLLRFGRLGKSNVLLFKSLVLLFLFFVLIGSFISSEDKLFRVPSVSNQLSAGIDVTLFPEFYMNDWQRRSIGGLKNTLYRAGILPYHLYQYDSKQLKKLDYLFVMGPKQKMTPEKAGLILDYVRKGGFLICSCGFDNRDQIKNLLLMLRLDIENLPLSYLSGKDTNRDLRFVSAWPIKMNPKKDYKIICKAYDKYPVIIEVNEGKGKILLIGDSYFFENRNLEGNYYYYKNNVQFIKETLRDLQK